MKQTYLIVSLALCTFSQMTVAQNNWNLARSWGGTNHEQAKAVDTDDNGNMYITGDFKSTTLTMGTTTLNNSGASDLFLAKVDPSGNVVWAVQSTGGTADDFSTDIVVASNDRLFITGYFSSPSITFHGTNGVNINQVNSSPGLEDGFVAAYDNNGGLIWVQRIEGASQDRGWRISADPAGVYLLGKTQSGTVYINGTPFAATGTGDDIIQAKYYWNGTLAWANVYASSGNDLPGDIESDGQKLFAAYHFYSSNITIGSFSFTNTGSNTSDIIVAAADPATGTILWAVQGTASIGNEYFYGIATDGNGNVYAHGSTDATQLTFAPSVTVTNSGSPSTGLITFKFRGTDGSAVWGNISSSGAPNFARNIVADGCNGIYVIGTYSSPGITFGSITLNSTTTSLNSYVVKYTAAGGVAAAFNLPCAGPFGSEPLGLAIDPSTDDLVLCGRFGSTATFGTQPPLTPVGNFDIMLARSDESGSAWMLSTTSSNKQDNGNDVLADVFGNVYVAGTFEQSTTFPSSAGNVTVSDATNTHSAYIAKYDACGNLLWVNFEDISGSCEGIAIHFDKLSGSIYMTGSSSGDIRFQSVAATPGGPAPVGGATITANGYYVAQFDKLTGSCQEIWSPNNANYQTTSISGKFVIFPSAVNQLYVCGAFNTGSATVPFVNRINDAGTMVQAGSWPVTGINAVNGTTSFAYDIAFNASENRVYITGEFRNTLQFTGTAAVTTTATRDGFVAAISANGVPVAGYLRKAGAASGQEAAGTGVTIDNTSRMCYTGFFTGAIFAFYQYPAIWSLSSPGIRREYTICINNNAYAWRTLIYDVGNTGNALGTGITSYNGNFYVVGRFNGGTLNFPSNNNHTGTAGLNRTFIAEISSTGVLNWGNVTTDGGDPASVHASTRIDATADYIYSTGSYNHKLGYAFGSPPSGTLISNTAGGGYDFNTYILRNAIYNSGSFRLAGEGDDQLLQAEAAGKTMRVYPNPAGGQVNIQLPAADDQQVSEVVITDMEGRTVRQLTVTGTYTTIDLEGLEAGMYMIRSFTAGESYTEKLLVQ